MDVEQALPPDLLPLPTAPWDKRPTELPLDTEECRTALWLCQGNISEAAEMVKVSPARFRTFVNNSEYLKREIEEAKEGIKDIAERNVVEALTDRSDAGRRDSMTRWFLEKQAKDRGYGTGVGAKGSGRKGSFTIAWEEGEEDIPIIEGTARAANGN